MTHGMCKTKVYYESTQAPILAEPRAVYADSCLAERDKRFPVAKVDFVQDEPGEGKLAQCPAR